MDALKRALLIFFAVAFVASVMTYRTDRRFSSYAYIQGISSGVVEIPSIDTLANIWTFEKFEIEENDSDDVVDVVENAVMTMLGFVKHTTDAVVGNNGFFSKCWRSIVWLFDVVRGILKVVPSFLPWNDAALVPVT